MDPTANLRRQATLPGPARMRELRHALADWLARGGFAPKWQDCPEATRAFKKWAHRYRDDVQWD